MHRRIVSSFVAVMALLSLALGPASLASQPATVLATADASPEYQHVSAGALALWTLTWTGAGSNATFYYGDGYSTTYNQASGTNAVASHVYCPQQTKTYTAKLAVYSSGGSEIASDYVQIKVDGNRLCRAAHASSPGSTAAHS